MQGFIHSLDHIKITLGCSLPVPDETSGEKDEEAEAGAGALAGAEEEAKRRTTTTTDYCLFEFHHRET